MKMESALPQRLRDLSTWSIPSVTSSRLFTKSHKITSEMLLDNADWYCGGGKFTVVEIFGFLVLWLLDDCELDLLEGLALDLCEI